MPKLGWVFLYSWSYSRWCFPSVSGYRNSGEWISGLRWLPHSLCVEISNGLQRGTLHGDASSDEWFLLVKFLTAKYDFRGWEPIGGISCTHAAYTTWGFLHDCTSFETNRISKFGMTWNRDADDNVFFIWAAHELSKRHEHWEGALASIRWTRMMTLYHVS